MLTEFINKTLKKAKYKLLKDGSYFVEKPGIKGVWASALNLEECRGELKEILEDWLILKIADGEKIAGFNYATNKRALLKYA